MARRHLQLTSGSSEERHADGRILSAVTGAQSLIRVDDLESVREAIEAAGGKITVGPFDFRGGRRFHFREPGGAEFAVWCPAD